MAMKRKTVYETRHPFNDLPFEAECCRSWHAVELLEIRNGSMTVQFEDPGHEIEGRGPFTNLRVRSRQATMTDCTCLLRPSMDVCVLLPVEGGETSDEGDPEKVWVDVKIRSVERRPHECQCHCQFYVSRYVNQLPLGSEKAVLSKETECIGIDQILILQKIEGLPSEGDYYRWDYSEDCTSLRRTKLLLGRFASEISWLLVASALKNFSFAVKSLQNKIIYEILDREDDQSDNLRNCLNFKVDIDILSPIVIQFVPSDMNAADLDPTDVKESSPMNVDMNLRRSKRRNVQPERFQGSDILMGIEVGWVRTMPIKYAKYDHDDHDDHDDDDDDDDDDDAEDDDDDDDDLYLPLSSLIGFKGNLPGKQKEELEDERLGGCSVSETKVRRTGTKKGNVKSTAVNKIKHHKPAVSIPEQGNPLPTSLRSSLHRPRIYSGGTVHNNRYTNYRRQPTTPKVKNWFNEEDTVAQSRWKRRYYGRQVLWKHRRVSVKKRRDDSVMNRKAPLSATAYNELINSYMRKIDSTIMSTDESGIIDQWEEFKAKTHVVQEDEVEQTSQDDGECSDTERLWKEMEITLATAYLMEDEEARVSGGNTAKSSDSCHHDFKMDEEIGILCQLCGFVKTEIKYVSPIVSKESEGGWTEGRMCSEEDPEVMQDPEDNLNMTKGPTCNDGAPTCQENENVWALVPDLRKKLHAHQEKAFEFLWRNIAGSLEPARMRKASKKIGGCVISHTPGAGKTFLIIAFLSSFLRLFPGKRPLILAPKTTLYTWYKEFIKWEMPFPVHLIHGSGSYRRFQDRKTTFRGGQKPSGDVMHILDCLEKIQKWHAQPSVLVMGYTSFLTFMREDSRFVYRKYMAKVLRESPGLLILDEGHNPRSTKSRLRKVLMKVETDLRILLSGTLFQNNFGEYFNTLCLARPKFIKEVLKELDKKYKKQKKGEEKARHLLEARARKFFADNIARRIDSSETKERMKGLEHLKKMTNKFIDVYEGGASDGLPGLQIYTILMNLSEVQHNICMKLQHIMAGVAGYPLELELLITLASIHPWLVKSSNCVNKFYNEDELSKFEKLRFDAKKGSKVMFVLNLVYRVINQEKVLIFCHNIAPITFFTQLFESVFRWQKGREIMVLTGDLELFERGRIIDKFEEPGGASRILLASITACAEGISLTAASRVIMLDSEWNPSKTKQAIARAFRPGQQKKVYVYQLLATGTLEEDKYRRTTWKDWVSRMIFSEEFVEDPSRWQAEKIGDEVLREMVEEDRVKSFHMIMKNEKASTG